MKRGLAKGVKPKMRESKKKVNWQEALKKKIRRKTRTGRTAKQILCTCHKFFKEKNLLNDI
jgi:hypothetical protein